ncbi:alpha/beta hydrolase [Longispora albida]|uniref:alpha/beta hydrolase n=1 Tax=Longispora albida TaxID=203523 RepID=UPI00037412CE|nr:alpha/beta hydrolase [Longispora albida]
MRRTLALALAATLVAVPLMAVPAQAAPPEAGKAKPVAWQPCPDAAGVECGTVSVPIDWSKPSGPKIEIALARRKATDQANRIGSILVDPGGPGGPGAEWVKQTGIFSPAITSRFDVVGFDPRGTGSSSPVWCDGAIASEQYSRNPDSPAEFQQMVDHNRRYGESCRALTGQLFDFLDTVSVVHDMDAIRAALGEKKLNYYGVSYGTLMGQQYAEKYPGKIRTMVIDSNMDHSISTAFQFIYTETLAGQENFDEFVKWCERSTDCVLRDRGARTVYRDLYARAERGELPLTTMDLQGMIVGALYGPYWRGLATQLDRLSKLPAPAPAPAARTGTEKIHDPFQSIFCQDWKLPIRTYTEWNVYRQAVGASFADIKLSPMGALSLACQGWPAKVRNPQHRLQVHGAPPILMLNSRYDPATPYQWATVAARQSGATLLTYDGWGHGSYFVGGTCVVNATETYLLTGQTPAKGTHCPAVEPAEPNPGLTRQLPGRPSPGPWRA